MTRREKLENKLERREEWAANAAERSEAAHNTAFNLTKNIPLGQPNINGCLTGVYKRFESNMDKFCEEANKAEYHEQKAKGLERQLKNTIFTDDPDAIEALEAKIAGLEKQQETYKNANKICRSKKLDESAKLNQLQGIGFKFERAKMLLENGGFESWVTTNNNANIRRLKQRIEEVKRRQATQAAAEANENGIVVTGDDYIHVTFAEFPGRETIDELKQAGFYWCGGSWCGARADLPLSIAEKIR